MNRVYFAHTKDSRIKIGASGNPKQRCETGGWKVITTIPGHFAREHFLHSALAPWSCGREFVLSCPDVWRVIVEAHDKGDLSWVTPEPFESPYSHTEDERQKYCSNFEEFSRLAGRPCRISVAWIGTITYGKVAFAAALAQRSIPDWLTEAHAAKSEAAE